MKKRLLLFSAIISIGLTSCIFLPTDEDDYKTPELFLTQAENWGQRASYHVSDIDYEVNDYGSEVYLSLTQITEYEKISKIPTRDSLFSVYEHIVPATSGPNIARMTIYNNGYLEILRKQSLGSYHRYYFSFDAVLAESINQFIRDKVNFALNSEKESREIAEAYTNIDNFFNDAKKASQVHSTLWSDHFYEFYSDISVVNLMYELKYTLTTVDNPYFGILFAYGDYSSSIESFDWKFELYDSFDIVGLFYYYTDSLNREFSITVYYSIQESAGRELYNLVLQYAREHSNS